MVLEIILGIIALGALALAFFYAKRSSASQYRLNEEAHRATAIQAQLDEERTKSATIQGQLDEERLKSAALGNERARLVAKVEFDAEEKKRLEEDLKRNEERLEANHAKALEQAKEQREKEIAVLKEVFNKELEATNTLREKELTALKDQFALMTNKNSDEFKQKSEKSIAELLKPVEDKFKEFSETVLTTQKNAIERHSKLEQKIQDLDSRSKSIGEEAKSLTNALLGYSKIQGDFGEMILTDLLTNAGLKEGEQFRTQSVILDENGREIKSDEGRRMIPDVTVSYPDNTVVIIDSKVSLNAYCNFMNSESAEVRKKFAKEHISSIRNHINELKIKDYNSYIPEGMRRVDYTIMFIPMEGAFRLMLEEAPTLWQEAKDNGILIVSQMTLIIVLNMIQMSWKQHLQEKNIAQVYVTAQSLMSQLRGWMEEFVKIGEKLDGAQTAYEASKRRLTGTQGAVKKGDSLIENINQLQALGLKPASSKAKLSSKNSDPNTIIPKELEQ